MSYPAMLYHSEHPQGFTVWTLEQDLDMGPGWTDPNGVRTPKEEQPKRGGPKKVKE
jgi:hypothetical protein